MITRAIDPVTDKEIVMISGPIDRIIIKEAEKTSKNLEYGVTHTASLLIGGTYINYISLGIKEGREPNIAINQGTKDSPKWVQIQETDEVKVIVTEKVVGDKTYYSAKRTGIKLLKKNATPGQQSQQSNSSSSQPKAKFDVTGVQLGHSVNGAMNFLITWGVEGSNENIISYGKKVHGVTEKLKKEHKEANPDMSDYDSSASVGNAILNACKLVGTEQDFEQGVYEIAKDLLENVVKPLGEFIRAPKEEAKATASKITRAPAKKAATKAVQVEELEFPEDDSDIPF